MTANMILKAEALAARSAEWCKGRSKRDGREFYVITSSDGRSAHYTTNYACTCEGFRRRGECSHREAVRLAER